MLKIHRFKINSNREIDYIKPKVKYSQGSIMKEVMIKFQKESNQ